MSKLTRYNTIMGPMCNAAEVEQLEAINAELLEALDKALDALGGNDPYDMGYDDSICGYIRTAIAKAKGVMP